MSDLVHLTRSELATVVLVAYYAGVVSVWLYRGLVSYGRYLRREPS